MKFVQGMNLFFALLMFAGMSVTRANAQDTVFESAVLQGSIVAGGAVVNNNGWVGVRFSTDTTYQVSELASRFTLSAGSVFIAIFPTDGAFPPDPPNVDDAVFVEVFDPEGPRPFEPEFDSEFSIDTDFMLPPGDWAMVIGSGAADAAGGGAIYTNNPHIGAPEFIRKSDSEGWTEAATENMRFVVRGIRLCGNGEVDVEAGEACDDGMDNGSGDTFCLSDCSAIQICGDDIRNGSEECDDGNTEPSDGCEEDCTLTQFSIGGASLVHCDLASTTRTGLPLALLIIVLSLILSRRGRFP